MAEYRRVGSLSSTGFEPSSTTTEMAQHHSSTRKPNVPSRPAPAKLSNVPSKEQQNKPPTTFFKKLTITTKKSARPQDNSKHKSEVNNYRKTTSFYKLNDPKSSSAPAHSRPTIIRSGSMQSRKKAPPPRPPPPKLNGGISNGPTSNSNRCPSYDEVVQADLDAFIGEMNTPRNVPERPIQSRPPIPSAARIKSLPPLPPPSASHRQLSRLDTSEPSLIDFSASPQPPPLRPSTAQLQNRQGPQALIDLDKIFSCDDEFTSSMPTQSQHTSSGAGQNNYKDWISTAPDPKLNLGPRVLPPGQIPTLRNAKQTSYSSSSRAASKSEDWLQSCFKNSLNGNVFGTSNDSATNMPRSPSSPIPPLPPRPTNANAVVSTAFPFSDSKSPNSSFSPPITSPPPVPPLPGMLQGNSTLAAEFDAPPLPPRPKQFETRPHAIALYDYTAMQDDELSFKASELITLVHYVSAEWLFGYTDSQEGIFPTNFAKVIVPLPDQELQPTVTITGPCCEALYDFAGENEYELTFTAGDIIALESRENNEWYKGTINGQTGTFPTTYVQVLKDLPASSQICNGFANNTTNYVAIYDFNGEAGELSFREGDMIIGTGTVSADWLLGHLQGGSTEGRFPKVFVQQIN